MNNNAMFKLSYGLFVITAKENGFDNGCIINTAQQVTDKPNRISVTINKSGKTHDMIKNTGVFNISIISEDADFELFKHFGFQSGANCNKFNNFEAANRSENGVFYITAGVNSYISANVIQEIDLGTHTMFIADVTDSDILSDIPSATYAYYHSHIKPKPNEKKTSKTVWRCKVCGYIYEGKELPEDFTCPICKHPASDFEKIESD
ncbi:MAG: flavin reductase [Eubacterium sp.]|nr:flavin reductase [Eubacterium sp.]